MSAVLHEPLTAGTLEDILLKYSDDTRLSDVEVPASVRWLPGRKVSSHLPTSSAIAHCVAVQLFSLAQGNHRREILASLNERDDKAMWKV